ncbi:MAG: hypothetical protein ACRCZ4_03230 [Plesiomonas sp.]|uniref:hypothetical protein n=1 Tax=Plesiomonas sp. TaxID=2486279 RepID=UPI003EE60484
MKRIEEKLRPYKGKIAFLSILFSWVIFTMAAMNTDLTNRQNRSEWVTYAFLGTTVSTSYLALWVKDD